MLVVNLEYWPHGAESKRESLGQLRIGNALTGTQEYGNYHYRLYDKNGNMLWWREYNGHKRSLGAWALVQAVLQETETKALHMPQEGAHRPQAGERDVEH